MAKTDRILEGLRADWEESHRKIALKRAIVHCKKRNLRAPAWLRRALCELGRAQVMSIEKGGRPRDWLWDSLLHDTVEEWRARGLTLDEAYHQTAQDFKLITGTNRHGNKGGDAETTVKSACLRWIARTDPVKRSEMPRGGENAWEPWTREIKPEWIEKDRDAKALAEGREPRRDKFNNWYMKQPLTNEEYEEEVRTELGLQQIMGFDKHLRPVLYPRAKNK